MIVSGRNSRTTSAMNVFSAMSPTYCSMVLPETSFQTSIRSSSEAIGVSESVPASSCQRRREKSSTTATSLPLPENRIAVGHPR